MEILLIIPIVLGLIFFIAWALVARYVAQLRYIRDRLDLTHFENMPILEYLNDEIDRMNGYIPSRRNKRTHITR